MLFFQRDVEAARALHVKMNGDRGRMTLKEIMDLMRGGAYSEFETVKVSFTYRFI
jgi:hypothetical protein